MTQHRVIAEDSLSAMDEISKVLGNDAVILETKKIKPHIPPRYTNRVKTQRGNFWDAETQMFYKWHQIEELKKIRGVKNDRVL